MREKYKLKNQEWKVRKEEFDEKLEVERKEIEEELDKRINSERKRTDEEAKKQRIEAEWVKMKGRNKRRKWKEYGRQYKKLRKRGERARLRWRKMWRNKRKRG